MPDEYIFHIYKQITFDKMIKRILYCFLFTMPLAKAFTVSDCQSHGEPQWFCEYMQTHGREYESKQEALARKERVSRAFELRKVHGDVFGLTSKSDHFPKELKSNNALVYRKHASLKRSMMSAFAGGVQQAKRGCSKSWNASAKVSR